MADITIHPLGLEIRFSRFEKIVGFLRDQRVPFASIQALVVVDDVIAATKGARAPGLGLPWRKVGTWRKLGHRELISVRRGQSAIGIRLAGHPYNAMLLGADDARTIAGEINDARARLEQ